jgi:hypothetical protein
VGIAQFPGTAQEENGEDAEQDAVHDLAVPDGVQGAGAMEYLPPGIEEIETQAGFRKYAGTGILARDEDLVWR